MSKRISRERAEELYSKELELKKLQLEGKSLPKSNRRHKKYLMQVKKQDGFVKYLIAKYRKDGRSDLVENLSDR